MARLRTLRRRVEGSRRAKVSLVSASVALAPPTSRRRDAARSRRCQLQSLLGELGEVLPRQPHGTPELRAQGWYAQLRGGALVFLGDYAELAMLTIRELVAEPPSRRK